jgi:hypothetical protein
MKLKYIAPAASIAPDQRYCTCCNRPITGRFAWLEHDQRDQTYHQREDIPEDKSQGWFPFGFACARAAIAKAAITKATGA